MNENKKNCVFDWCAFNYNYECTFKGRKNKCYVKRLEEELNKFKLEQIKEER